MRNKVSDTFTDVITKGEEPRSSSVESIILLNGDSWVTVDISAFFSRYRFPKLKCVRLVGCGISPWDLLESRAVALTALELGALSPTPTLPKLLSILPSNPLLQDLVLSCGSSPRVVVSQKSTPRVPLRHLKKLQLRSGFPHAFWFLNRLEHPNKMDRLGLFLDGCSASDLSQTLGPYLGDLIRCRGGFPGGGLGSSASHSSDAFYIQTGDARKGNDSAEVDWLVGVTAVMGA